MIYYKHAAGTTYGTMSTKGTIALHDRINNIKEVGSHTNFLDIGSGEGKVLNDFKEVSKTNNVVGVEFQKRYYLQSLKKYPDCEVHLGYIQDYLKLVKNADIIYTNNICIPDKMFWDIWDSIKPGSIVIYNLTTLSIKLRKKFGYDKSEFSKISLSANNMRSEFHIIVKK